MKKAALIYLAFLTVLLVVRNPLDLFGNRELVVVAFRLVGFLVHFLTFTLLGWLMLAARFRLRTDLLLASLIAYAGATELAQFTIPGRTADVLDFAQDVAGLALGSCGWWICQRVAERRLNWNESS